MSQHHLLFIFSPGDIQCPLEIYYISTHACPCFRLSLFCFTGYFVNLCASKHYLHHYSFLNFDIWWGSLLVLLFSFGSVLAILWLLFFHMYFTISLLNPYLLGTYHVFKLKKSLEYVVWFCLWQAYIQMAERTNRHEQWTAEDVKNCVEYIRNTEETQKRVDKEVGRG